MKKILLVLLAIVAFTACKKEPVEVSGVVTYYFNEYQGDKPDTGAKIYLTKTNLDTLINALSYGQTEWLLSDMTEQQKETQGLKGTKHYDEFVRTDEELTQELQTSLTELANKYNMNKDTLTERAYLMRKRILEDKSTASTTVDATGRYSLKVEPGKYNVIIISKGREGLNLLENSGRMIIENLEVKDKIGANKDFRFGI